MTPTGGGSAFLVPPIVFDDVGDIVTGRDLMAGVEVGAVTVYAPVLRGYTPAMVEGLDAKLAHVRDEFGITSISLGPVHPEAGTALKASPPGT